MLTAEQFESLIGAGDEKGSSDDSPPSLRGCVRARHRARWEGGVLTGETELVIASRRPDRRTTC